MAWWFFLPKAPKTPDLKPAEPVSVQIVEVPPPPPLPPTPAPPQAPPRARTPASPFAGSNRNPKTPPVVPAPREPSPPSPPSNEPVAPQQGQALSEPGSDVDDGGASGPVDLFSQGALQKSVQGWSDKRAGSGTQGKGRGSGRPSNSPEDEARRVGGRVDGWLAQAQSADDGYGDGPGGGCDDGIDNDFDGHIDCSDPGCRQIGVCDFTGVYVDTHGEAIPDGDGRILVRELVAKQEGRIRKLTVRVRLGHGDTRQLNVNLVAPSGEKVALHSANDSDTGYVTAFYVRELVGVAAAGIWTLEIEDTVAGVVGRLLEWGMYITS